MSFHDEIIKEIKVGDGLSVKEWRQALDRYLTEKTLTADEYTFMNREQRNIIQEIKKAYARIARKN